MVSLRFQPALILAVRRKDPQTHEKLPKIEDGIKGKFVVATDKNDENSVRLYGLLYNDPSAYMASHRALIGLIGVLEGITIETGLLLGGGNLFVHHGQKIIDAKDVSTELGNVPIDLLEKTLVFQDQLAGYKGIYKGHILKFFPALIPEQAEVTKWYIDHGFQV